MVSRPLAFVFTYSCEQLWPDYVWLAPEAGHDPKSIQSMVSSNSQCMVNFAHD